MIHNSVAQVGWVAMPTELLTWQLTVFCIINMKRCHSLVVNGAADPHNHDCVLYYILVMIGYLIRQRTDDLKKVDCSTKYRYAVRLDYWSVLYSKFVS